MGSARSATKIFLAFVISVGITVTFTLGAPGAVTGTADQQSFTGDRASMPRIDHIEPSGSASESTSQFPQFEEVSSDVGFDYKPGIPAGIEDVNSGVYVADVDNNGYEDLLAVGGKYPTLFENTGGRYVEARTFEHEAVQTAHFFDFDNDGDRDLLLAQYAGSPIFYENLGGTFVEADVGFDRSLTNPTSIVTADFTGNSCLDVFITQNGLWAGNTPLTLDDAERVQANHPDTRPTTQSGTANLLYYGNCEQFTDATDRAGIHGRHWSLTSSAVDFTGDGYPDIHVGNDWSRDYIYVNAGNGTFERREIGPASDRNAMSSSAKDMNGDFHLDLFITNIYYPDNATRTNRAPPLHRDAALPEGNNYFVNDGTGNFTDRASEHDLHRGGWGWTATVADFNNDGHSDIVQTTESIYWVKPYSSTYSSLQVWQGSESSWTKMAGEDHGLRQKNTYSIARTDYDNDGDLDIVTGTAPLGPTLRGTAQPFKIYGNQQDSDESLQFFVRDPTAIDRNAAVYIETDKRTIYRTPNSRGNFQTQDSRLIHVGAKNEEVKRVTVLWPDGTKRVFSDLEKGNRYILAQDRVRRVL